jgi:YggT family protein
MRPGSPVAPVAQFLYRITEPVLAPVRRALPSMGGIDLSPLVVILGIQILMGILL